MRKQHTSGCRPWLKNAACLSSLLSFRLVYVGVTTCPLNPWKLFTTIQFWVLVVANAREVLCDVYTIWHECPFTTFTQYGMNVLLSEY